MIDAGWVDLETKAAPTVAAVRVFRVVDSCRILLAERAPGGPLLEILPGRYEAEQLNAAGAVVRVAPLTVEKHTRLRVGDAME